MPEGTSREEAQRRLKAAGIDSSPGANGSISYVALWNRPNGERWHMNVALLFDAAGNLYRTRAANAATGLAADVGLQPDARAGDPRRSSLATDPSVSARPDARPTATSDDDTERVAFPGQVNPGQGNKVRGGAP